MVCPLLLLIGIAKGGVALAKAGVNVGLKSLENAAYQFMKMDAGTIKGFTSADEINSLMKSAEWAPAWKSGTAVAETTIKPGTTVRMVVTESQYMAIVEGKPAFGGFATLDEIPNQSYAHNKLAITIGDPAIGAMKTDISYVVELKVKQPINAQIGVVGPQELGGQALSGGGNQIHFLVARDANKAELFEFVGGNILLK